MQIIELRVEDGYAIAQATALLMQGFAPVAWATWDEARAEVQATFVEDRICRIAIDEQHTVLGWVAGESGYGGRVWEVLVLVVADLYQGHGVGRALMQDFELCAKARGGLTVMLGTDDEQGRTTLSEVDLFSTPCEHISAIQNLKHHPYEFYQKLGYTIVGVVPDANGLGKPDILMAKSLVREV